jgi:glycosyltransferase involved in cell wall biosynthesis
MFSQSLRYTTHRLFGRGPIRLIMTILVKNERDIIEDNIRTHGALGVDAFLVMDNGSTDGTRELLQELGEDYELHVIDQPEQNYQQREWMTRLAFHARDKLGADWVVSNDADEFWIPRSGDLKTGLNRKGSVITYKRHNMLLEKDKLEAGGDYHASHLCVQNPIFYSKEVQLTQENISIPLVKISPKVLVNPHGLFRIKGGNHRAKHIAGPFNQRHSDEVVVYHYPIRSYAQFERNVRNREALVKLGARMGDHYRRWVRLLQEGKLEQEFERFVMMPADIEVLDRFGVIARDTTPGEAIERARKTKAGQA